MVAPIKGSRHDTTHRLLRLVAETSGECTARRLCEATGYSDDWVRTRLEVAVRYGWVTLDPCKWEQARHYSITEVGQRRLASIARVPDRFYPAPPKHYKRWSVAVQALMCEMHGLDPKRQTSPGDVATILGLHERTWRRWRAGPSGPSLAVAAGLAVKHGFTFGVQAGYGYWVEAVETGGE